MLWLFVFSALTGTMTMRGNVSAPATKRRTKARAKASERGFLSKNRAVQLSVASSPPNIYSGFYPYRFSKTKKWFLSLQLASNASFAKAALQSRCSSVAFRAITRLGLARGLYVYTDPKMRRVPLKTLASTNDSFETLFGFQRLSSR